MDKIYLLSITLQLQFIFRLTIIKYLQECEGRKYQVYILEIKNVSKISKLLKIILVLYRMYNRIYN